ncbi:MAG: dTDP-4-dehydrorhamnose 3,5-epimerase [Sandaracinus sp.]|nr:dTDP-4-dehydrorhamnose 3,5-epimerase [Sandaracinus sp.]|tara:strand:- start:2690 stop:3256 length:567 start_codon:yes stop_codon:yes gene_type:complete
MKAERLAIEEVVLVTPKVHGDHRGFFVETFHEERYREAGIGVGLRFVQDNMARSTKGILRGLHLQEPHAQGKLVSCVEGAVFDVAVDVRLGSPTFGKWVGARLDAEQHQQLWVPPGFAHGYQVLSEVATFAYKCTDLYHPEAELGVAWDDPEIGVEWPLEGAPVLSAKDQANPRLSAIDPSSLPQWSR